jgi:hypothetical protein
MDDGAALQTALQQWAEASRNFDDDVQQVVKSIAASTSDCLSLTVNLCRALQPPAPATHTVTHASRTILATPRGIAFTGTGDGCDRMHVMQMDRRNTARVECYVRTAAAHIGYTYAPTLSFTDPKPRGPKPAAASAAPANVKGCECLIGHADSLYYWSERHHSIGVRRADDATGASLVRIPVPSIDVAWPTHMAAHARPLDGSLTLAISGTDRSGAVQIVVVNISNSAAQGSTLVVPVPDARSAGVAFDINGDLYAVARGGLFKIDTGSAASCPVRRVVPELPDPAGIVFCRGHVAMIAGCGKGRVVCVNVLTSSVVSDLTFDWHLTGHMAVHRSGTVYATTLNSDTPIVDIT